MAMHTSTHQDCVINLYRDISHSLRAINHENIALRRWVYKDCVTNMYQGISFFQRQEILHDTQRNGPDQRSLSNTCRSKPRA